MPIQKKTTPGEPGSSQPNQSQPSKKHVVHKLMGGDLQLFQKNTSCFWQCAATVGGRQFRYSTKKESFADAQDVAKDWFVTMTGKAFPSGDGRLAG